MTANQKHLSRTQEIIDQIEAEQAFSGSYTIVAAGRLEQAFREFQAAFAATVQEMER